MKPRLGALFAVCIVAQAQTFEQPRQQFDLYGGGSYRVGVDRSAAPVFRRRTAIRRTPVRGVRTECRRSSGCSIFGAKLENIELPRSLADVRTLSFWIF